jgi:hypothetical protein
MRTTAVERLKGRVAMTERPITNTLFSEAQELAIVNYVDQINAMNLSSRMTS